MYYVNIIIVIFTYTLEASRRTEFVLFEQISFGCSVTYIIGLAVTDKGRCVFAWTDLW